MIVYAALDEMHFVNRKLDANHMLPPYAWPPPSANMCMGDGSLLLKAGNSKQRCHQCANILGPTG